MAKKNQEIEITSISYKDIGCQQFNNAFSRLMTIRSISSHVRNKIVKLARLFSAEQSNIQEVREMLLEKYVEQDDKGEPIILEDKINYKWKSDEDREKFNTVWSAELDDKFKVTVALLQIKDLDKLELSPKEMLDLTIIFKDE